MSTVPQRILYSLARAYSRLTRKPSRRDYTDIGQLFEDITPVLKPFIIAYVIDAELFLELMTTSHLISDPVNVSRDLMTAGINLTHIHMFTYTE